MRSAADHSIPPFALAADLASARVGGRAVAASDDFFAPRSNLVKAAAPVFVPGKFTSRGKWMDGWESRRRRTPGHDWCVVALGMRGRIRGVDVDTTHFTGNHPSHCSIEAIDASAPRVSVYSMPGAPWTTLVPQSALRGDSHNFLDVADERPWTLVRLNIYPDGGVARLRVYGEVEMDWAAAARSQRPLDLASIRNGGLVLAASDMHFGARDNMIMPGRAANMGDGWETRRRRDPAPEAWTGRRADWAVVRLGAPGIVRRIEIDTRHFKGNYPAAAAVDGCLVARESMDALRAAAWHEILPETRLQADRRHMFTVRSHAGDVSHVRLHIFPDGGVSRFRVHGTVAAR